jgi:hypothetical protein
MGGGVGVGCRGIGVGGLQRDRGGVGWGGVGWAGGGCVGQQNQLQQMK